jgi:DNA-binding transcriptional LysR family regulator
MADPSTTPAWDDLRLVKAIADAKGLAGAAARLGVNHSTVFRRLGQLEVLLGTTLFERHRTGYALTCAGEEMAALAERIEEDVSALSRRLAGRQLLPAGELRVTTSDTLLIHLLTPLLAQFQHQCPDVRLDVVVGNQALNLSKRDADVAVRASDHPPEILVGRRVARIAWALYGSARDFPRSEPPEPPEFADLLARRWVALGDDLAGLKAGRFVRDRVPQERIVYKVNTPLGLAEAIEAGAGIGHLPCFIADQRPGLVRLAPPEPEFAADLWLLTHPDLRHSARVRVFLDFLAAGIARQRRFIEGPAGQAPETDGAALATDAEPPTS